MPTVIYEGRFFKMAFMSRAYIKLYLEHREECRQVGGGEGDIDDLEVNFMRGHGVPGSRSPPRNMHQISIYTFIMHSNGWHLLCRKLPKIILSVSFWA